MVHAWTLVSEYESHRPEHANVFFVHKVTMFELNLVQGGIGETGEAHSMILPAKQFVNVPNERRMLAVLYIRNEQINGKVQ